MTERKAHVWEVDSENFVHTRWCPEAPKTVQPYFTSPRTAIDLLAQVARPDIRDGFHGDGILRPCATCVLALAEREREDLP